MKKLWKELKLSLKKSNNEWKNSSKLLRTLTIGFIFFVTCDIVETIYLLIRF